MGQLFLLLLIAICWGLPTLFLKSFFTDGSKTSEPLTKEEGKLLWWFIGVGYPLGLILFIIFIKSLPD